MPDHTHDIEEYDEKAEKAKVAAFRQTFVAPELEGDLVMEEPEVRPLTATSKAHRDLPKPKVDNSEAESALRALRSGKPIQGNEGQED